jgi:hypothetical protein
MSPAASPKPESASSTLFHQVVRETYERYDGDLEKIRSYLTGRLKNDVKLRAAVVEHELAAAIREGVNRVRQHTRRSIITNVARNGRSGRDNVLALASATNLVMMNFPIVGGKKLQDATRAEVADTAEHYATMAATHNQRARWFRAIAQAMPDEKMTVADALTEDRLVELWGASEHA